MTDRANPIKAVVAHFGGQIPLALAIGTAQSTVSEWVVKERVPSARIPIIIDAAARLDPPVRLDARDFFPAPATQAAE